MKLKPQPNCARSFRQDGFMNSSARFQTGGIVLLAMSIVFCGVTVAMVIPMLDRANQPLVSAEPLEPPLEADALRPVLPEYSEFYPRMDSQPQRQSEQVATFDLHQSGSRSRTEQASFAQQVPNDTTSSNPQFRRPTLPARVNSTNFYSRSREKFAEADSKDKRANQEWAESRQPTSGEKHQRSEFPNLASAPVTAGNKNLPKPPVEADAANTLASAAATDSPGYSPGQIPTGNVYAPVTVNLDTSMFSEQIRALERRLDNAAQATAQETQPPTPQPTVEPSIVAPSRKKTRQDRVAREDRRRQDDRDKELARIGDGLKELVTSFRELQQQTNQSLREVAFQNQRQQPAAVVIQQDDRNDDLSRIGDGLKDLVTSFQQLRQQTNESLQEVTRQAERQEAAAQVIEAYRLALVRDVQEIRSLQLPQPTRVAARPIASDVPLLQAPETIPQKAATFEPNDVVPAPVEIPANIHSPAPVLELPREVNDSGDSPKAAASMKSFLQRKMSIRVLPREDSETFVPLEMTRPKKLIAKPTPEIEGFAPILLPADNDSAALVPVPVSPRQVSPVGYANTYRFKMAVVETGESEVVPLNGVCAECGKSHGPTEAHASRDGKIIQTAAVQNQSPPKSPEQAKVNLRRDTRNAGRGMNRKIGVRKPKPASDDDSSKGFLRLQLPTMTTDDSEPGILHRMSSTIRQLGRSAQ